MEAHTEKILARGASEVAHIELIIILTRQPVLKQYSIIKKNISVD
jgi:hypothetical protein